MGANCCVAAKSTASVSGTGIDVSTFRNDVYSPSCSFRWDNRTHIEESVGSRSRFSHGNSETVGSEIKSSEDTEPDVISDGECPFNSFRSSVWQKSPSFGRDAGNTIKGGERDLLIGRASSIEEKEIRKLSTKPGRLATRSFTFSPSSSVPKADPSSSRGCSLPSDSTSLRKIHESPSHHMLRQTSDSHISFLASQNENSPSEEMQSFAFPSYASDLSTGGSNGGSSENWSVHLFSELITYSQRDRWSFDGDSYCFGYGKTLGSNCQSSTSPAGLQKCGVCSKLLKERSPWSGRKLVSNEVPVTSVLVCGHVYHGDCLEKVTSEVERFDPSCPVCSGGGKPMSKMLTKAESKSKSKISRIAVRSIDFDDELAIDRRKGALNEGKDLKLGASCSIKSSTNKPFLKRHFSLGSRAVQPSSENEGTKKKGFWFRHLQ